MSSLGEEAKDWVISIVIAIVLAFIIRQFVVELYIVDGPSMRPTLQSQERLVVNKFIYDFRAPQKGEILVFEYPRDTSRDFIKRVIATPGDTIEIKYGRVYVNDQMLDEVMVVAFGEQKKSSFTGSAGVVDSRMTCSGRGCPRRTAASPMSASCPTSSSRARPCSSSGRSARSRRCLDGEGRIDEVHFLECQWPSGLPQEGLHGVVREARCRYLCTAGDEDAA